MTALQVAALVLVALAGTSVVLIGDVLRQTLVLGVYGIALTVMFFSFQAPDVALSEIVVSAVAMPVIVLAALRKLHDQEAQSAASENEEREGP